MRSLELPPPTENVPLVSTEQAQSPAVLGLYSVYPDRAIFAGFSYGESRQWRRWLVYTFTMEWWKEHGEPKAVGIPVDKEGLPAITPENRVKPVTL